MAQHIPKLIRTPAADNVQVLSGKWINVGSVQKYRVRFMKNGAFGIVDVDTSISSDITNAIMQWALRTP